MKLWFIFINQNYVLNVQNLLSDITRKESDLNNVSRNAQLYQQAVKVWKITIYYLQSIILQSCLCKAMWIPLCGGFQDYESEVERFKSILDLEDGLVSQSYKRSRLESPAMKVNREVSIFEK